MSEEIYNKEDISDIMENVVDMYRLCGAHKEVWKIDKEKMLELMEKRNPLFYNKYHRICKTLVEYEDIRPLITMLKSFYQVQTNKLSFTAANKNFNDANNSVFVDPVLNSEKLVKEREMKMTQEKKN